MKRILTLSVLAFINFSPLHAATYFDANVGVSIEVPDDWKQSTHEKLGFMIQDPSHPKKDRKIRIHFTNPAYRTPKDALEGGMDNLEKRAPQSSNTRIFLLSSTPIITANKLQGLRAQFGEKRDGKTYYGINKYFFPAADGRIFCVCAYVYGDTSIAEKYDTIILKTLKLAPSP